MAGQDCEYLVFRVAEGRASHIAERLNQHAEEGYEPVMMCGDATVTLILRRPKPAQAQPAPQGE